MTIDLLVVDSNNIFRDSLCGAAKYLGLDVVDFINGDEALDYLKSKSIVPRAYFVDIGNPFARTFELNEALFLHQYAATHGEADHFYFLVTDPEYAKRYLTQTDAKVLSKFGIDDHHNAEIDRIMATLQQLAQNKAKLST